MVDYEESVAFLGTWGPYQRRIFFLLCISAFPSGYSVLSVIFLLATPAHHCSIPPNANLSLEWSQAIIPQQGGQSSCSRYSLELALNATVHGLRPGNTSGSEVTPESFPLEECGDGWSYSQEHFTSTVVTEFSLVCGDQWKQPLSSLVFFLGGLCGCFVCGQLSDRFGRKPVLFGSLLLLSVFNSALSFAPSWPVFIAFFFMVGLAQITLYIVAFVLGSELLTGGPRVLFSSFCLPFCFVLGSMLLPYTAYLLTDWRHLAQAMATPSMVCLLLWWTIPESPRWLMSRGRLQDAERLLTMAALENRVEPPFSSFSSDKLEKGYSKSPEKEVQSLNFLDLLKTRNIRHITIMLWLAWFSTHVTYFGLSFNSAGLSGSPFLNYFLISAIEIPAYLVSWLAAGRLPRRVAFILFVVLGAVALLLILITTDSYPKVTLSLVLLGKFGVLAGISSMYIHTGELFPTIIRNTAVSSCAMFSRVGSSLSPYLQQLALIEPSLPWLLVGALSLFSVLLVLFLPESFNQSLPDTIEQMGRPQGLSFRCKSTSGEKDDGKCVKVNTVCTGPEVLCTTHL